MAAVAAYAISAEGEGRSKMHGTRVYIENCVADGREKVIKEGRECKDGEMERQRVSAIARSRRYSSN